MATRMLEGSKWSDWTQKNVVPAQYYRDPSVGEDSEEWERYLEKSGWIADVNNDRRGEEKKEYRERLVNKLGRFVMLMWRDDETVVPKESGWFGELESEEDEEKGTKRKVRWMKETRGYKEDLIGLRTLDEQGRIEFIEVDGGHMELSDELLKEIIEVYLGPEGKKGEFKWPKNAEKVDGGEL